MTIPITAANSQNRSAISRSIHSLTPPARAPRPLAAVSGLRSSSPLPNAARQLARCFSANSRSPALPATEMAPPAMPSSRAQGSAVNRRRANRPLPDHPRGGAAPSTASSSLLEPAASLLWCGSRRARSQVLLSKASGQGLARRSSSVGSVRRHRNLLNFSSRRRRERPVRWPRPERLLGRSFSEKRSMGSASSRH